MSDAETMRIAFGTVAGDTDLFYVLGALGFFLATWAAFQRAGWL